MSMPKKIQVKHISDAEVLAAIRLWKTGGPHTAETLMLKYPWKVIELKMQRMTDRGILNYGTCVSGAWIEEDNNREFRERMAAFRQKFPT